MNYRKEKDEMLLDEEWDLDASASDNESFELEMVQDDTIIIPGNRKKNT